MCLYSDCKYVDVWLYNYLFYCVVTNKSLMLLTAAFGPLLYMLFFQVSAQLP